MAQFPYLEGYEEEDPLLPNGTPRSLALAPAPVAPSEPEPAPLNPVVVDYLAKQKAERDALVNATNEVNPLALAFSGLSGVGAALQGRDAAGAVTNTMNIAKSGAANRLKQFDEQARRDQAEKDRATKGKFEEFNLSKMESEKALRDRENDPNSEESKIAQRFAKDAGYDMPGLTAAKMKEFRPDLERQYKRERDKLQDERQARLDIQNAAYRREDLADRREARALSREDRGLRREEVDLLRQEKRDEKMQKLVTPFGDTHTPKDADDVKNAAVAMETLRGNIGRILQLREEHGGETFNTDARVEAKTMASAARGQLKEMLKLGVLSATDYTILDSQIPADPLANEYSLGSPTQTTLNTTLKNAEAAFRTNLKTRIAKPNDAYRQMVGETQGAAQGGAKIMVFPDGSQKKVPADKVDAMIKAGGKVV